MNRNAPPLPADRHLLQTSTVELLVSSDDLAKAEEDLRLRAEIITIMQRDLSRSTSCAVENNRKTVASVDPARPSRDSV